MISIDLSDKEAETLRQILEDDLSDLRMEIADTDSMAFRETLKDKKEVLQKVIGVIAQKSAA
jgi:hypothetical protein